MIIEFLESWELFHDSYLTGWLIAVLLSQIGVVVITRDQIFLGAAVSQASTLGIAVILGLATLPMFEDAVWLHGPWAPSVMAVLFSIAASLITVRGERRSGRESPEAVTGWVFLASSSLSILLVSSSPHGLEEIHKLLFSSIVGATPLDTRVFLVLTLVTFALVIILRRRILLITLDPAMASSMGLRTSVWSASVAIWLGLAVGLSIKVSGSLYTFGCLILPALVAKNLCRRLSSLLLYSPCVGAAVAVPGFVLAHHYDYPPAQLTVFLMVMLLLAVWGYRALRPR